MLSWLSSSARAFRCRGWSGERFINNSAIFLLESPFRAIGKLKAEGLG